MLDVLGLILVMTCIDPEVWNYGEWKCLKVDKIDFKLHGRKLPQKIYNFMELMQT